MDQPEGGPSQSSDSYSNRLAEFDSKVKKFADAIESTRLREEHREEISVAPHLPDEIFPSTTENASEVVTANIVRSDGVSRKSRTFLPAQSVEAVARLATPSLGHSPFRSALDRTVQSTEAPPPVTCVLSARGRQTYSRKFLMRFADTCTTLMKPTALPLRMMGIDKRFAAGGHASSWTRSGEIKRVSSMNKVSRDAG
jgi:hypothetical protein